MSEKGYTTIPDWMLSLDLDIYEVIILAVIYGFSQDGESWRSSTASARMVNPPSPDRRTTLHGKRNAQGGRSRWLCRNSLRWVM